MAASIDIGKPRRRPNFTDEELFAMIEELFAMLLEYSWSNPDGVLLNIYITMLVKNVFEKLLF